jgi:hypothetical protein
MPTWTEMVGDGPRSREKTLGLARGFAPWPARLPLPGGWVRVLGALSERPMVAMFHSREQLALGCSIALEFIGDDTPRHVRQACEQLAKDLLCGLLVPPTLDQDIQHISVLIDGTPEIGDCLANGQKTTLARLLRCFTRSPLLV